VTSRPHPRPYPHLEAFLGGYLHQDFAEEHGTLAGAVGAFQRDASQRERSALAREWLAFRTDHTRATLAVIRAALGRLGGAWTPRRTADLAELDRLMKDLDSR
jgi:hypothetical protein